MDRRSQAASPWLPGANRGIGKAITEALLAAGAAKVYAAARNTAGLGKLKQQYGARVELLDARRDE